MQGFEWWRRSLGAFWLSATGLAARLAGPQSRLVGILRRRSAILLGAVSLSGGFTVSLVISTTRPTPAQAAATFFALLVWLAIGFTTVWWSAGPPAGGPVAVFDAWAFGLVPWVLLVLPGAGFLAWGLSAPVTAWSLGRVLGDSRAAWRSVGGAWGVQAAVALLVWLWSPAWIIFSS